MPETRLETVKPQPAPRACRSTCSPGLVAGTHVQSFVAHHLGQISTAVQVADAETIANRAAHIAFTRSLGMR